MLLKSQKNMLLHLSLMFILMYRGNRLQAKKFQAFPELSVSLYQTEWPRWLEPFKAGIFRLRAAGGKEGRRGQWRSTPEAFLLLLKTEQPSRPFWKTCMPLIQIQLPYRFNTDAIEVQIVFYDFSGPEQTSISDFWFDSFMTAVKC